MKKAEDVFKPRTSLQRSPVRNTLETHVIDEPMEFQASSSPLGASLTSKGTPKSGSNPESTSRRSPGNKSTTTATGSESDSSVASNDTVRAARGQAKVDNISTRVGSVSITDKWQLPDETWSNMSGAERRQHLRKKRTAMHEQKLATRKQSAPRDRGAGASTSREGQEVRDKTSTKRGRADMSTGSGKPEPKRQKANNTQTGSNTSYRDILKGKKMVIVHTNFPNDKLTQDQSRAIESEIEKNILESGSGDDKVVPVFCDYWYQDGHVNINCENDESVQWLRSTLETIVTVDVPLKLIAAEELPKMTKIFFWVVGKEDWTPENILGLIQIQNPTLKGGYWIHRLTKEKPGGRTLFYSVDSVTLDRLKALNYTIACGTRKTLVYEVVPGKEEEEKDTGETMETDQVRKNN